MITKIIPIIFAICIFFISIADAGMTLPEMNSIVVSVNPDIGAIYLGDVQRLNDINVYNFTYILEFNKFAIPSRVWIQYSFDDKKSWSNPGIEIVNLELNDTIVQQVNLTKELTNSPNGFLGEVDYRVISNLNDPVNSELYNGTGPVINVNLKDESWIKEADNSYCYQVAVKSSNEVMDIYLYSRDSPNDPWTYNASLETYRNNTTEWQTLKWIGYPYYYNVEFVPASVHSSKII